MSLQILHTGRGFEVSFKYNPAIVEAVKSINGAYFRSKDKTWIIPRHREWEVKMLKETFGLMVDPEIDMPEQFGEIPELPDLEVDIPLKRQPFSFQRRGIARGMQLKRYILGDQPGLGKTLQAIATVEGLQCKCILIICPNTLKMNWQSEIFAATGNKSLILSDKTKSSWQTFYKVGMIKYFIVNYESLKKFFVQAGWQKPKVAYKLKDIPFRECVDLFDAVIVDECHKTKDGSALQSKLTMGICKGKEVIIGLSGTPVVNKPRDLIAQLVVIDRLSEIVSHIPQPTDTHGKLVDYSGIRRFENRYCDGGNGQSNLKELNYRLNQLCFFRREKHDVLKDLPDKIRQVILCEISNRAEYTKAENDFINYLKEVKGCTDAEVKKKLRGQMMVKIGVLKQISARGKIEAAQEYIDEVIEGGQKIVVFCHLKEIVRELKGIYPGAVTIVGDDDMTARNSNIKSFQNDPAVNIIICSLSAAGVGITLTASSEVLLIEFPWTDALLEQAIDRTHRIGQNNKVRAALLLGEHTIDRYCYEVILKKRDIHKQVTGSNDNAEDEIIDELLNLFNQK